MGDTDLMADSKTRRWLIGELDIQPLTSERWDDFAAFFAANSPVKSCWCMWWRLKMSELNKLGSRGSRQALKDLADKGDVAPGLVAYLEGKPIGWCSIGPREGYGRLNRSPALRPIDDKPVWSIVCFFVDPAHRNSGVAEALLAAAVVHARGQGALTVESYPRDHGPHRADDEELFTGPLPLYLRGAGFHEVARRSPKRPILRLELDPAAPTPEPPDKGTP
jgi:GNAT superfamily N-acetyltransferase